MKRTTLPPHLRSEADEALKHGPWQMSLPWPPTVNTYWRKMRGRIVLSVKGREYRELVAAAIIAGRCSGRFPRGLLGGRLWMEIRAFAPDHRRRDVDNLLKGPLDAMQAVEVYGDDSQVDDLRIIRERVEAPGYLLVSIGVIR